MGTLAQITGAVGVVLGGLGGWALAAPAGFRGAVQAFPRHRGSGWVLTLVALTWSAYALQELALGGFDVWKERAYYIIPVAFGLMVYYLDELLAARSLGGVLVLLPTPWLDEARWSESEWSLVPKLTAYVFAVAGMYLIATPYRFRLWLAPALASGSRTRVLGGVLAGLGLLHLLLAAVAF